MIIQQTSTANIFDLELFRHFRTKSLRLRRKRKLLWPCRGEIPHLKHVYQNYKDKGFEIISVSIDQKNKDWQKAMKEEKMPWIQLNDPQGENGPAIQVYNVTGVPHCILLDKEGKIFKTNMRGAYLDAALEQLIP